MRPQIQKAAQRRGGPAGGVGWGTEEPNSEALRPPPPHPAEAAAMGVRQPCQPGTGTQREAAVPLASPGGSLLPFKAAQPVTQRSGNRLPSNPASRNRACHTRARSHTLAGAHAHGRAQAAHTHVRTVAHSNTRMCTPACRLAHTHALVSVCTVVYTGKGTRTHTHTRQAHPPPLPTHGSSRILPAKPLPRPDRS